jgi:uncharacterized protein (TIGR04255 family)
LSLPEYEHPPVNEVVLGVHFESMERLGGPYIGLLWQEFRARFAKLEEKPPLIFPIERFGSPVPSNSPSVELVESLPSRVWFVNDSETELLQVQPDWFSHNWRKVKEEDEYPRYQRIRTSFYEELATFLSFIERENLGRVIPLQCEVTYVNLIPMANDFTPADVITVFTPSYSDAFLPNPESVNLAMRFVIGNGAPIGRLHIVAAPVILRATGATALQLTLTARGKAAGETLDDMFGFLDVGHEWIVRAFTSITTTQMHEKWRRIQ